MRCGRCLWSSESRRTEELVEGPIVALLAHVDAEHRCPFCGSVMRGSVCPRCDARFEVVDPRAAGRGSDSLAMGVVG